MSKRVFCLAAITASLFFTLTCMAEQPAPRVNTAVMNLFSRGGLTDEEVLFISDRFRGELANTETFTVIERDQMDAILKEQGFQQSGACSEETCIVEVGQLLAVHKMVAGSIGKIGKVYSINLKLIDVKTGKIEKQVSDDFKCPKEDLVSIHISNTARKMAGLPLTVVPKKRNWYLWAPAAALLVGGGALVTYFFLKSEKPEDFNTVQVEVDLQ